MPSGPGLSHNTETPRAVTKIFSSLAPEARLLFLMARDDAEPDSIKSILEGGVNWPLLSGLTVVSRAGPAVWAELKHQPEHLVPAEARDHLRQFAMVTSLRMSHLEERMWQVFSALEAAGIEVIILKGAALALDVYGSFSERPMSDLDILVRPEESERARAVLLDTGWTSDQLPEARQDFYQGHHHMAPLKDAHGTELKLEIHTSLFAEHDPFVIDSAELWESSVLREVGDRRIRVLAQRYQLLHLCVHFAWSHTLQSGSWRTFRDLHALSRKYEIDWKEFAELAERVKAGTAAYWALRLATTLALFPAPDWLLDRLRPPLPEMALRRVETHFAHHALPGDTRCPSVSLTRKIWEIGIRPEQSGHGPARPWLREDIFLRQIHPEAQTAGTKLRRHWSNLADWVAYGRRILAP